MKELLGHFGVGFINTAAIGLIVILIVPWIGFSSQSFGDDGSSWDYFFTQTSAAEPVPSKAVVYALCSESEADTVLIVKVHAPRAFGTHTHRFPLRALDWAYDGERLPEGFYRAAEQSLDGAQDELSWGESLYIRKATSSQTVLHLSLYWLAGDSDPGLVESTVKFATGGRLKRSLGSGVVISAWFESP